MPTLAEELRDICNTNERRDRDPAELAMHLWQHWSQQCRQRAEYGNLRTHRETYMTNMRDADVDRLAALLKQQAQADGFQELTVVASGNILDPALPPPPLPHFYLLYSRRAGTLDMTLAW